MGAPLEREGQHIRARAERRLRDETEVGAVNARFLARSAITERHLSPPAMMATIDPAIGEVSGLPNSSRYASRNIDVVGHEQLKMAWIAGNGRFSASTIGGCAASHAAACLRQGSADGSPSSRSRSRQLANPDPDRRPECSTQGSTVRPRTGQARHCRTRTGQADPIGGRDNRRRRLYRRGPGHGLATRAAPARLLPAPGAPPHYGRIIGGIALARHRRTVYGLMHRAPDLDLCSVLGGPHQSRGSGTTALLG